MKRIIFVLAVAGLATFLPGCKKGCYECVKGADTEYQCRDSHPNQKSFESAIDLFEANGYSCKKQ